MDNQVITQDPKKSNRKLGIKIITLFLVLAASWHAYASFLWVSPYNSLRDTVPGGQQTLQAYMIPMFGQSWSVFAPEPINGNYDFEVRAKLSDGTVTDWFSMVDAEQTLLTHKLFPPRASQMAANQASNLKGQWDGLSDAERKIVAKDYTKASEANSGWLFDVTADLQKERGNDNVYVYIAQERRAAGLASLVAQNLWGDEVKDIQFKASRQNNAPFSRDGSETQKPPLQVVNTGWRGTVFKPGQSLENFDSTFDKMRENLDSK